MESIPPITAKRTTTSNLFLAHWTQTMGTTTYDVGNPDPGLVQTYIHIKQKFNKKKPTQIRFHSKRPHTITQMNDNMDSTISGSMHVCG